MTILALDIGNTRCKLGWFAQNDGGKLQQVWTVDTAALPDALIPILDTFDASTPIQIGWMSVGKEMDPPSWSIWDRFSVQPKWVHIASGFHFPIENRYATPETLGTDRIVAAIGAYSRHHGTSSGNRDDSPIPILVIDAGTAITYDIITATGTYLGGGISPGMQMRFRALHEFTARLPLIHAVPEPPLVGDSTESCIQSGVINGLRSEVLGIIEQYRRQYGEDLAVYITGGDAPYFDKLVTEGNQMSADAFLTLSGIDYIVKKQQSG